MSARNIKRKIEDEIVTLLKADSYVVDNSLKVREWFNISEDIEDRQLIVHALPEEVAIRDENGIAKQWRCQINLYSYVHNSESEVVSSDTLYEFLMGWIEGITIAALAAATGLTITGKNNVDSDEAYDERFRDKYASMALWIDI